jgi:ankyrin repeat protein
MKFSEQVLIEQTPDAITRLAFLKLLIEYGAAVDLVDTSGLTPYQVAVDVEDRECALFLQSKGALP